MALKAFITNAGGNSVSIINIATNAVVTIPLGLPAIGVAVHPAGTFVYVTHPNTALSIIDTSDNSVNQIGLGLGSLNFGVAITPNGAFIYVTDIGNDRVVKIDTNTLVMTSIPLLAGSDPRGIASNGNFVVVANSGNSTYTIIDPLDSATTFPASPASAPTGVAMDSTFFYLTNEAGGSVAKYTVAGGGFVANIGVGINPFGIVLNPTGTKAYVAVTGADSVVVIDTAGLMSIDTSIPVGDDPIGISITPDGSTVYVANSASDTVTKIDTATNTVIPPTIPVGDGPRAFGLFIVDTPCPVITIGTSSGFGNLPSGLQNSPYNAQLTGNGGVGPYTFTVTSGSLPAGITLSPAGLLSGTPTGSGSFTFTISALDVNGCGGSITPTLLIAADTCTPGNITLDVNSINNQLTIGVPYSDTIDVTGGVAPYTFIITSGSLPAGLTLNTVTGEISGVPTVGGSYSAFISVIDANGCVGSTSSVFGEVPFTFIVNDSMCEPIQPQPNALHPGVLGAPYLAVVSAIPVDTYMFTVIGGQLPTGLILNANGTISGTPTLAGNFGVLIQAMNPDGCVGLVGYIITIASACPAIILGPGPLPDGTIGSNYSTIIPVTGGVAPYTYSVTSGDLPVGLNLIGSNSSFELSGVPTLAGIYNFQITATDVNGCIGTQDYSIFITSGARRGGGGGAPIGGIDPCCMKAINDYLNRNGNNV